MKRARFGSTYTKIGTIQRRLAWPLRKDDTQIREAFHIFLKIQKKIMKHHQMEEINLLDDHQHIAPRSTGV